MSNEIFSLLTLAFFSILFFFGISLVIVTYFRSKSECSAAIVDATAKAEVVKQEVIRYNEQKREVEYGKGQKS